MEQYYIAEGDYPEGITGEYQEICNTGTLDINAILVNEGVDCTGLVDLRVLVPNYVAGIPKDSTLGTVKSNILYKTVEAAEQDRTGYEVARDTKVSLRAINPDIEGNPIVINPIVPGVVLTVEPNILLNLDNTIIPDLTNAENYTCTYDILGNITSQACNVNYNPDYDNVTTNIYDALPDINIEIEETGNVSNTISTTYRAFITKWDGVEIAGYNGGEVNIPLYDEYEYDFIIRWGDDNINGTERISKNAGDSLTLTRTYTGAQTDTYISIIGDFPGWNMDYDFTIETALKGVEQWGTIEFESFSSGFAGAYEMEYINNIDIPRMSQVTDMSRMFADNSNLEATSNIGNWDVSNVINMYSLFGGASSFNQPIGNWNTSSVTNMREMFYRASVFNQDISSWNVSSVEDMGYMFYEVFLFNQPIGNWNVSSVVDMKAMFFRTTVFNQDLNNWNVSSVEDMNAMFAYAESFNQPIGNWNVSSVEDMRAMFTYAESFNQPIGNWNVSSVIDMTDMFYRAISFNQDISNWDVSGVEDMTVMFAYAESFNQDLSGWCVPNLSQPIDFDFGTISWTLPRPVWGTCPGI